MKSAGAWETPERSLHMAGFFLQPKRFGARCTTFPGQFPPFYMKVQCLFCQLLCGTGQIILTIRLMCHCLTCSGCSINGYYYNIHRALNLTCPMTIQLVIFSQQFYEITERVMKMEEALETGRGQRDSHCCFYPSNIKGFTQY